MDKDSNDPTSPDALEDFLDGVEEKIGPDFGTISSREEMREVKTEIAREIGVEEEYHPNVLEAINEHGDDGREAYEAVEERYEEHLHAGRIQEAPDWDDSFEEWNRMLDQHHRGKIDLTEQVENTL